MAIAATRRALREEVAVARASGRDWRAIVFRGMALLITFFVLGLSGMATSLLAPWVLPGSALENFTPEMHRWHGVDIAALLAVLVCGSLLALVPRPRSAPLLAQFALVGIGMLTIVCTWPFAPDVVIPCAITAVLFAASYPGARALVSFSREGAVSWPLLALATIAAIPLLGNAWTNLRLQHTDMSEHTHFHHWNGGLALALTLIIGGFMVASRRPGWKALGMLLGVAYLYLGVAALVIPTHDGSWGYVGGMLALMGAVAYVGMTFAEGQRTGREQI